MKNSAEIIKQLQHLIFQRYDFIADKTLLQIYRMESDLFAVPPEMLQFVYTERQQVCEYLKSVLVRAEAGEQTELLALFLRLTKQFVYQQNQFIAYTPQDEQILEAIYRKFLDNLYHIIAQADSLQILSSLFREVLIRHHLALRAFTDRFLQGTESSAAEEHFLFSQPVCEEYSERLQWDLLGVSLANVQEPVLDLGCGEHGRFVHFLRAQGIEAYGIDRLCAPSPYLRETDWFQFGFQAETWGTIFSHLAFSNHFLFQHIYKYGTPERYARLFMTILTALKVGGSFCYTPGIPFFETFLPAAAYGIRRTPVVFEEIHEFQARTPYHDLLGEDVNYVTRIRKLAG